MQSLLSLSSYVIYNPSHTIRYFLKFSFSPSLPSFLPSLLPSPSCVWAPILDDKSSSKKCVYCLLNMVRVEKRYLNILYWLTELIFLRNLSSLLSILCLPLTLPLHLHNFKNFYIYGVCVLLYIPESQVSSWRQLLPGVYQRKSLPVSKPVTDQG